jgi:hypothetical protein
MTAEALERMTDAGKFEKLAMPVLRELYPPCKTLAHLGVNAEAKTIPGLVDGFCRVPGSNPAQYIMAAFTSAGPKKLKDKWLFDTTVTEKAKQQKTERTDGDLIKAAKKAVAIRKNEPKAKFIVYRKARWASFGQSIARLQQATSAAASTLLKVMVDPSTPASTRVRAAESVLTHAAKSIEIEDIEARVTALEQGAESSKGRHFG